MNIVVSVNDHFLFPLEVMLFSLAQNTKQALEVYLLYHDLSVGGREKLKAFVQGKCHGTLHEIMVDGKAFREHDASKSMFSTETFYRLFIPYLLPENVDRALWLDADMVINGNIDDFYESDFGEDGRSMLIASWNDRDRKKLSQYKDRLGEDLKTESYFNAGMLLFHLPAIRERISAEEIMNFWLANQKKLKFLDQDIINCLMGEYAILKDGAIYNNQAHYDPDAVTELAKAKVIHFVTYRKPWKLYYEGDGDGYFWKYAKNAGFVQKYLIYLLLHKPVMVIYRIYKLLRYGRIDN